MKSSVHHKSLDLKNIPSMTLILVKLKSQVSLLFDNKSYQKLTSMWTSYSISKCKWNSNPQYRKWVRRSEHVLSPGNMFLFTCSCLQNCQGVTERHKLLLCKLFHEIGNLYQTWQIKYIYCRHIHMHNNIIDITTIFAYNIHLNEHMKQISFQV